MIWTDLGKRYCNLRLWSIVLFILNSTVSRCFSKDNRLSRTIPKCFWYVACITLSLLSTSVGCDIALDFRLKMTSCGLIWFKTHFPLKSPSAYWLYFIIASRSSFRENPLYSLPPCTRQVPYLKFKWQQRDSNPQPLSL